jgi:hypothetical protein
MKLFNKHEKCFGISLWRFGNRTAELWFCPPSYQIEEHCHPNQDIELMFISGCTVFKRRKSLNSEEEGIAVCSPFDTFTKFTVSRGYYHHFSTGCNWLVFINFARWYTTPTSAAIDFSTIPVLNQDKQLERI